MPVVAASGVKFNFLWTFNSPASTPLLRSDGEASEFFLIAANHNISSRRCFEWLLTYTSLISICTLCAYTVEQESMMMRNPAGLGEIDIRRRERGSWNVNAFYIYITRILSKIGFPFNRPPAFKLPCSPSLWLNLGCSRLL